MYNLENEAASFTTEVRRKLQHILEEMISDWDIAFNGRIAAETMLIRDLEFESIDVVQLVVAIEEEFDRQSFPFSELIMRDGRYVDDLSVGQIVEFLVNRLESL